MAGDLPKTIFEALWWSLARCRRFDQARSDVSVASHLITCERASLVWYSGDPSIISSPLVYVPSELNRCNERVKLPLSTITLEICHCSISQDHAVDLVFKEHKEHAFVPKPQPCFDRGESHYHNADLSPPSPGRAPCEKRATEKSSCQVIGGTDK